MSESREGGREGGRERDLGSGSYSCIYAVPYTSLVRQ